MTYKLRFDNFVRRHAFFTGIFLVVFGFVFFASSLVVANGQTLGPSDNHVVSLFVDNQESSVPTRASTVEEFLNKADIKLNSSDLVEPALSTKITEDNFRINVYRARPVAIIDENQQAKFVLTPHKSAKLIAEKAGLKVYPEDNLRLNTVNEFIAEQTIGEKLVIDRATPVTLSLYGAPPATYRTHAQTVGEFLRENKITPEAGATLSTNEETPIINNLSLFISKFGKKTISEEVAIPFATQSTNDPNQPAGKITVLTPGRAGKKQVTYELDMRDGREVGRTVIQEVVIEQPSNQTQTRGTKIAAAVSGNKTEWMRAAGIPESQFAAADFVIGHESGWRPGAMNAGGCAGLGQACPGSKLAAACPNWQTDPVCQLKFFNGYAVGRYGSWQGAYNFWLVNHWW